MKALIVVDVQVDFCPGGMLPSADGNEIVPVINKLMEKFDLVIASRDWHPQKTEHFKKWPVHCVQGSHGAEFHPMLKTDRIRQQFLKGTQDRDDGYSAFEATNENLNVYLKENNIDVVYVCGIATEFCVKETAIDSHSHGYKTFVVEDAVAAVKVKPTDDQQAKDEMKQAGVLFVRSSEIGSEVQA